jgi:hypothetical protein
MSVRITREQAKRAQEARTAALKEDPEFRAAEEEEERLSDEAQQGEEAANRKEPQKEPQ